MASTFGQLFIQYICRTKLMLGPFEQVCDFVKSDEKGRKLVEWKLNQA